MIFVTGATGLVGRALVQHLLAKGQRVIVGLRAAIAPLWAEGVETCVVGSLGQASLDALNLQGVDVVVHCAARAHIMRDIAVDPLSAYRRVNTAGTLELARRAAACGVRRFVFISSIKVNGESTAIGQMFGPDDIPQPQDPYGVSKREAEDGLRALAAESGMEVVIIRPPLVYGPGVKANFAALMRWAQRGIPLPLGGVHNLRSLVALDNLVDFIDACCQHPAAANQTFLVSDGQDVSIAQLLRYMAAAFGKTITLVPVPVRLLRLAGLLTGKSGAVVRLCGNLQVDIKKNEQLLGWRPVIAMEEGLRRIAVGRRNT